MVAESSSHSAPVEKQRILLVTGVLGAGKTTVLRTLEDLGWETIDNFPIRLLGRLIDNPDLPADSQTPLVIGFAAGPIPALPLNLALLKGASIVGVFWGDFAKREPRANAAMLQELVAWYAAGRIKPVIDKTMPMAELKAAYARMGSRAVQGKLVLVND